jgi:uncharacterized circularly permuted ATP-grasp superfamily protein
MNDNTLFDGYDRGGFYDEMFDGEGGPRSGVRLLAARLAQLGPPELLRRQRTAERALLSAGITFQVYGAGEGTERVLPFDLVPRVIEPHDWAPLERGLQQRIVALNHFVGDIYGEQRILKDGVVPAELVASASSYLKPCHGIVPIKKVYTHITGTDLVRDKDGQFYVLEDNLRCPSGVSYVLQNRQVMKRTLPHAFTMSRVRPVDGYASHLLSLLRAMAPPTTKKPTIVLLTPGMHNSAYFEHAYLAQQMGIELVEGRDLRVVDGRVAMRTTRGMEAIDVIYRRIDDVYLDPKTFHPTSMLGVPGLFDVYRKGKVALVNAPGNGVADDKVIYAYVPEMIKYYLGEDAILPNVPTYLCFRDKDRQHVLENLDTMVVKAANESGGYGMLVGPHATAAERAEFAKRILAAPRNYVAQSMIALSRVPTLVNGKLEGRHVDLRPYALYDGEEVFVLPGGLTRVALRRGSVVVNSSQGGGSKDTWVLQHDAAKESEHS